MYEAFCDASHISIGFVIGMIFTALSFAKE